MLRVWKIASMAQKNEATSVIEVKSQSATFFFFSFLNTAVRTSSISTRPKLTLIRIDASPYALVRFVEVIRVSDDFHGF